MENNWAELVIMSMTNIDPLVKRVSRNGPKVYGNYVN